MPAGASQPGLPLFQLLAQGGEPGGVDVRASKSPWIVVNQLFERGIHICEQMVRPGGEGCPMSKILSAMLVGAAFVAIPTGAAARDTPDAELQKMLAGRSAGAPVSCIGRGNTSSVTIIKGKAIVYRVGSRLYVNTPADPTLLRDDDVLITSSPSSDLCDHDRVSLVARGTRIPHGFTVLGKFVPYSKPAKVR